MRKGDEWPRFDVGEMACQYALGFGTQLEVLEPEALREKVAQAAADVVAYCGQKETQKAYLPR